MILEKTALEGVYLLKPEKVFDDRGYFMRIYSEDDFAAKQIHFNFKQSAVSFNHTKGTWRGMHFQTPPYEDEKLVSCTRGVLRDYVVDIRPASPTFKQWFSIDLYAEERWMLYLPKGIGHGIYTLNDNTELTYHISQNYQPNHARGIRWNDPLFNLKLPMPPIVISDRDQSFPDFDVEEAIRLSKQSQ